MLILTLEQIGQCMDGISLDGLQFINFLRGVVYSNISPKYRHRTFIRVSKGMFWLNTRRMFAQIDQLIMVSGSEKKYLFAKCTCFKRYNMYSNIAIVSIGGKSVEILELCQLSHNCAYVEVKKGEYIVFFDSHYSWNNCVDNKNHYEC